MASVQYLLKIVKNHADIVQFLSGVVQKQDKTVTGKNLACPQKSKNDFSKARERIEETGYLRRKKEVERK